MRINGLNGANTPVGGMNMTKATDSVSKNIQNQIANAQKQLQELSANKDMSIEEKMKTVFPMLQHEQAEPIRAMVHITMLYRNLYRRRWMRKCSTVMVLFPFRQDSDRFSFR